ncbi:unnamed protein product [Alopecurus aequalis]
MECNVYGSPSSLCQEATTWRNYFYAYLNNNYLESLVVPCFVREQLNRMVGKLFIAIDSNQEEFIFYLKKGLYITHIFGHGFQKFIAKHDLTAGDRIRVQLDHPPQHFLIEAEPIVASPDQTDDDSEEDVLDYEGTVTVFTNALNLTDAQTNTMNMLLLARGIGMGAILVHKLTESDVHNNGLHIPKRIVSALKIKKKGWSILRFGDNDNHIDAKYYKSTDGRIKFSTGCTTFVDEFDLDVEAIVLVMFHKDDYGYVNFIFDVL